MIKHEFACELSMFAPHSAQQQLAETHLRIDAMKCKHFNVTHPRLRPFPSAQGLTSHSMAVGVWSRSLELVCMTSGTPSACKVQISSKAAPSRVRAAMMGHLLFV